MSKTKATTVTGIIATLFFGILIAIGVHRQDYISVMTAVFAVPGIIYTVKLLFQWLSEN